MDESTLDQKQWENEDLFMISALQKDGTQELLESLCKKAKPGEWHYAETAKSDLDEKSLACEILREKVFKYFSKDVPFDLMTTVKLWKEEESSFQMDGEISV